jgi:hypothetical protein
LCHQSFKSENHYFHRLCTLTLPNQDGGEAIPLVFETITGVLQSPERTDERSTFDELSRKISANGVSLLKEKFPGVKFVVQTLLIPKLQDVVGLSMSTAAVWEPANDLTFNVRWENKFVQCIVSVVAITV